MLIQKLFEGMNYRIFDRFREISENPEETQKDLLFRILRENQTSDYGKQHGFKDIASVEDFQKRVPIVNYSNLESRIERIKRGKPNLLTTEDVLYFATTSGSTNTPKFIPITKKRLKAFKDEYTLWAIFALRDHPKMIRGKSLLLTGSNKDGNTEAGTPHGSISGYLASKLPWYVKSKLVVPFDIYNIQDFDAKIHQIARLGLEANVSQLALSSPIEVLLFFDYIQQNREQLTREIFDKGNRKRGKELDELKEFTPTKYWPNLTLLNYIKGGFARFYQDRVQQVVGGGVAIRDPGIYSSEGRVSLCLSEEGANGVIAAGSNFFEFMEFADGNLGKPITIGDLEHSKKYSVLLTTQEGLYRYDLGDIVRVADFYQKLPVVEFVDRRERGLSIVGEHVTESELVSSVKEASESQQVQLVSFTTIPNIDETKPRYEYLVEFQTPVNERQALSLLEEIEKKLQSKNFVYRKMRQDYGRLDPPIISIVNQGSFNNLDMERIKEKGVRQIKPVNLEQNPEYKKKFEIEATYSI